MFKQDFLYMICNFIIVYQILRLLHLSTNRLPTISFATFAYSSIACIIACSDCLQVFLRTNKNFRNEVTSLKNIYEVVYLKRRKG